MKKQLIALVLIFMIGWPIAQAQTSPTGNDNQGGVSAPPGSYAVTPSASSINAYTANATRVVVDLSVSSVSSVGLSFVRYNNTRATGGSQLFGVGGNWRHSFQWDFALTTINGVPAIELIYPDGTTNYFTQTSPNVWTSSSAVTDMITPNGGGWQLTTSSNIKYEFTSPASGIYLLTSIIDAKNLTTTLTYSSVNYPYLTYQDTYYLLNQITEPGGHYLTIGWSPNGAYDPNAIQILDVAGDFPAARYGRNFHGPFITSVSSSDSRSVSYAYSNRQTTHVILLNCDLYYFINYLTSAAYSDGSGAAYRYDSSNPPQLLQANDSRAVGFPNITYSYFGGSSSVGAVQTIQQGSTGANLGSVSLNSGSSQAPQITYPDSSLYDYSVNVGGLLASIQNTLGAIQTFAYASNTGTGNWTMTMTDSNGNSVATAYTLNGKLLSRTWPKTGSDTANPVENWYYNAAGYLTSYTDTLNHTTTFTRDPSTNLVTKITYADGTSESFTYNSFSEVLTHTRINGGVEKFAYDSTGLLQTETDALGNSTSFTYNSNYRIASITDALNHTTSFQYNDLGRTTKITFADNNSQTFTYDSLGNLLTMTNELGNSWSYTYDSFNRLLTQTDPLKRVTTYQYDPNAPNNSAPVLVTDPSGHETAATYNAAWGYKAYQIIKAYGTSNASTTAYGFDANGNVTSVTDPLGNTSHIAYDARNRGSSMTDALGHQNTFVYDDASNVISVITPDGTSLSDYNAVYQLTEAIDPKGQTTKYAYDPEGALTQYTDPDNKVYGYAYDLDERQLSMTYPDGTQEKTSFDSVGHVLAFTNRKGAIKTMQYDARNRIVSTAWNDSVTLGTTYTYDAASEVTGLSNVNSALSYTYDAAGQTLSETENITGLGSKTVSYAYNTDGTLSGLTYPDGTALNYAYDARAELTSIAQGSSNVVSYAYDSAGNRTGKNLANGVNSTLAYDALQRLISITDLTPTSVAGTFLQKFEYGYDALSRRKYVAYNATNPDTTPSSPSRTVSYAFNAAGNRTQVTDSQNGSLAYLVDADNQYTKVGANPITYDGNGNLTTTQGETFTYDAENHLIKGVNNGVTLTQSYDPLGRCVKRTQGTTTTYLVYDLGWNVLSEYNGAGTQTYRYVGGAGTDEILTRTDASGNVTKLTDATGKLVEQYSYDVYGAPTITDALGHTLSQSAYSNRFLFTGREYLYGLDIYDFRRRSYSPGLGRFLQPDPIGHLGDGYNIYRYCGNNPVNESDRFGLDASDTMGSPGDDGGDFGDSVGAVTANNAVPGVPYSYGDQNQYSGSLLSGYGEKLSLKRIELERLG